MYMQEVSNLVRPLTSFYFLHCENALYTRDLSINKIKLRKMVLMIIR